MKRPRGLLFYILGLYVFVQFAWWAYMLVELNAEIYELNLTHLLGQEVTPETQVMKGELDRKLTMRIWMVLGEGAVFAFILILGLWSVQKTILKELALARQQKNFLLSITHELKSPLAAIKLLLQTLQTRKLPEEKKEQLYGRALNDTHRLEVLIENLLLVNKVESGGYPLSKSECDISKLVTDVVHHSYQKELDSNRIILKAPSSILGVVDQLAIQSVVTNLVDNSIKYGAGSEIEIRVEAIAETQVRIVVADQGPGILKAQHERVFDRFYRLGNEDTRQTKGTGIGLYLVKLLVEKHGGSISLNDNTPSGAVFSISLPIN